MRRWGRRKAMGWLSGRLATGALTAFSAVALAGTALAGTALATPASAALAANLLWKIQKSPNVTAPGGQLGSVSCSAADACTAVGSDVNTQGLTVTLAERWNGTSWQRQPTPQPGRTVPGSVPGLTGVSCPAANFCAAVGTNQVGFATGVGLAYGWNGSVWTQQSFSGPPGSTSTNVGQVSCTSASFCEAVGFFQSSSGGFLAFAARWNGSSWQQQGVPGPFGNTDARLTGVSCVSRTFCVAAGSAFGTGMFAELWNGTSWQFQTLPDNVGLGAVSCTSAAFCEVVSGAGGNVWNGSSWSAQTIPSPANSTSARLTGVSCVAVAFCEAVGQYSDSSGNIFSLGVIWNGTSWALQATPNPATASVTSLSQVSCAAVAACEAAGSSQPTSSSGAVALAESWNGSSWQLQHAASPPGSVANNLNAVSCVSTVSCETVGSHFDNSTGANVALAEVWNGATWKIQNTPANAAGLNLNGVSCVSAAFCEAVGSSSATVGGAEVWNGTAWALQAVPGGSLTSVSCTSASFCMAAGADGHVDIWNGSSWSAQPTAAGLISLSGVSCTSPTSCEAAGTGTDFNAAAERWNGTTWSQQAIPAPSNGGSPALSAVSCTAATSCEAVGSYSPSTGPPVAPLAEVWNGTAWSAQSAPAPATTFISSLAGVWCTSASSCTAVGQSQPGIGPTVTVAEVWNGTAWRLQATPNHSYAGQNVLNGVSCGASRVCTAVGVTTNPGQTPATLVEAGD